MTRLPLKWSFKAHPERRVSLRAKRNSYTTDSQLQLEDDCVVVDRIDSKSGVRKTTEKPVNVFLNAYLSIQVSEVSLDADCGMTHHTGCGEAHRRSRYLPTGEYCERLKCNGWSAVRVMRWSLVILDCEEGNAVGLTQYISRWPPNIEHWRCHQGDQCPPRD